MRQKGSIQRNWTVKEINTVKEMRAQGCSRKQIAAALGRTLASVQKVIERHTCPAPKKCKRRTGVGWYFSSAHRDRDTGLFHGHTWEVTAWFVSSLNAVQLQQQLKKTLEPLDHTALGDDLAWGEDIAQHILFLLPDCIEVEVSRPAERIYAKAIK